MGKYIAGFDRNQYTMLPISFDEMIEEDNPVRAIDLLVESMDINK